MSKKQVTPLIVPPRFSKLNANVITPPTITAQPVKIAPVEKSTIASSDWNAARRISQIRRALLFGGDYLTVLPTSVLSLEKRALSCAAPLQPFDDLAAGIDPLVELCCGLVVSLVVEVEKKRGLFDSAGTDIESQA